MTQLSDSASVTSPSLLLRAAAGDDVAWQRMVQIYGPLVYTWLRRAGAQSNDAADLMQETFLTLATKLSHFDGTIPGATFRGWLWTIAKNKWLDQVRRVQGSYAGGTANLQVLQQLEARLPRIEDPTHEAADRAAVVSRALEIMRAHFAPKTWQAFWRTTVDGVSPDSVADELGITRWTVYKSRARVLERLRRELGALEEID
ncbi:MAG: sigma-70 family RNA polymerase sigma factor [Pirellulaceae bacterium]